MLKRIRARAGNTWLSLAVCLTLCGISPAALAEGETFWEWCMSIIRNTTG